MVSIEGTRNGEQALLSIQAAKWDEAVDADTQLIGGFVQQEYRSDHLRCSPKAPQA